MPSSAGRPPRSWHGDYHSGIFSPGGGYGQVRIEFCAVVLFRSVVVGGREKDEGEGLIFLLGGSSSMCLSNLFVLSVARTPWERILTVLTDVEILLLTL
jgi:hypothetical protein